MTQTEMTHTEANVDKPRPKPRLTSEGSRQYHEGCRHGELRFQQCRDCQTFRFPPQLMCSECNSTDVDYVGLQRPTGHVVTFVVVPKPLDQTMPMGAWPASEYPIAVVISEIQGANGVRIVTNFAPADVPALRVGLPVEFDFVAVDEFVLPQARPAKLDPA
jgi:uncharacterized protein